MDLRIKGLGAVDPKALPLPNGTEVTASVDRMLGERRVPQGASGRVVRAEPERDEFDVHIVGVGVVRYARSELVPRKIGQVRYAQRRNDAWQALRPCVVIETTVGSRAWGVAHEGSDTDTRGVFALPLSWTMGLVSAPEDLVSEDGSHTFWAVAKCIKQALRADPNTLEALFVKSARATDEIGEWILAERDAFVSAEIYGSFGRYATSQLDKLSQNLRLVRHRADVLDWLRADDTLSLDQVAEKLAAISPRANATQADAHLSAKQYIKQLYRSMYDQGLLERNEFSALVEFAKSNASIGLELPRELRPKNAYNLLRLIVTATEWLKTGAPEFEVRGAFREKLLSIKRGEVALDAILEEAESLTEPLAEAWRGTKLPRKSDVSRADRLLHRVNNELAKRWVSRAAGPWGEGAPEPPIAEWDED
ncbi:MAG: nucleotidyltransferase domain-containing protein [Polyangiales bacterium]